MRKSNLIRNVFSLSLVLILSLVSLFCSINTNRIQSAEYGNIKEVKTVSEPVSSLISNQNFGETDMFTFEGTQYGIDQYATDLSEKGAVLNSGEYIITQDNPIINIVPKHLFKEVGENLYIGKEYGYYINTTEERFAKANTSTGGWDIEYSIYNKHSFVIVFDIENEVDITLGTINSSVNILFQYEFVYATPDDRYISYLAFDSYVDDSYHGYIKHSGINDGYVVRGLKEDGSSLKPYSAQKYYLKDISFGVQLYNEQDYNVDQDGYNVAKDEGYFLTSYQYGYNGLGIKNGEFPSEGEVLLRDKVLDVGIGLGKMIPLIGGGFEALDTMLGIVNDVQDTKTILMSFNNYNFKQQITSVANKINVVNFPHSKKLQNDYLGGLVKSAGIAVNSENTESMFYNSGNHAEALAKFTCDELLNGPGTAKMYNSVALKVVDLNGYEIAGMDISNQTIGEKKSKNINLDIENTKADVVYLENSSNIFTVIPNYSSNFDIYFSGLSNYEVLINNESQIVDNDTVTYLMSEGVEYSINIKNTGIAEAGHIIVSTSNSTSFTIPKNSNYMFKSSYSGWNTISSVDNEVKINSLYKTREHININDSISIERRKYSGLLTGQEYVLLTNETNNPLQVEMVAKIIESISIDKKISVPNNGFKTIYRFNSGYAGDVTLILDENIGNVNIYDSNGSEVILSRTRVGELESICFSVENNKSYFIDLTNSTEETVTLSISKGGLTVVWYVDNIEAKKVTEVKRGSSVIVKAIINSHEVTTFHLIENGVGVSVSNNKYTITPNSGFGIGFYLNIYSNNSEIPYSGIIIRPVFEGGIQIGLGKYEEQNFIVNISDVPNVIGVNLKLSNGVDVFAEDMSTNGKFEINLFNILQAYYDGWCVNNPMETPPRISTIVNSITYAYYNEVNEYVEKTISDEKGYSNDIQLWKYINSGNGSKANPYLLSNTIEFNNIRFLAHKLYYFELKNDINFSGKNIKTGNLKFYGNLYGLYDIKNIKIESNKALSSISGLFAENHGSLLFIDLEVDIIASGLQVNIGGAVIDNYGTMKGVGVRGNINSSAGGNIGGVASINYGDMSNCINNVNIIAGTYIGGIASVNYGVVEDCIISGVITITKFGSQYVGGVVGSNSVNIDTKFEGVVRNNWLRTSAFIRAASNSVVASNARPRIGLVAGVQFYYIQVGKSKIYGNRLEGGIAILPLNAAQYSYVNNPVGRWQ